ncbi:MAG: tetratricopeptide repeat protein [Prolixibacteraceae bacterium]|nr:tetratricopeptide repeat protein [Prolixibacteraceae bacterium]
MNNNKRTLHFETLSACSILTLLIQAGKLAVVSLLFLVSTNNSYSQQVETDAINKMLLTETVDTTIINRLYEYSKKIYQTKPDECIDVARQSLLKSSIIDYKKGSSRLLNVLGLAHYQKGEYDSAQFFIEKSFHISSAIYDTVGIAQAFDNLGTICLHRSNYAEAMKYRQKANELYLQTNDSIKYASGLLWIGNILKEQGEYDQALNFYLKSLSISEIFNDINSIGICKINISSIYRYLKQYDSAIQYANDAITNFKYSENLNGIGFSLYRLALVYHELMNYEISNKYLLEAQTIFETTQNNYFLCLANLQLGANLKNLNDYDAAFEHLSLAKKTVLLFNDKALLATIKQNIGTVHYADGDTINALKEFIESDIIFKELNIKEGLLKNASNFIEIYSYLNEPDSVVKYLNRYKNVSDTLLNENITKSIAEMQLKYETEKKDKELTQLQLEGEQRNNQLQLIAKEKLIADLELQNAMIEAEKQQQSIVLLNDEKEQLANKNKILELTEQNQLLALKREKANKKQQSYLFLFVILSLLLISITFIIIFNNQKTKEKALLTQKITENGLKAIRSQMNPHFIFNCVHTIEQLLNDLKIEESKNCLNSFSALTRRVLENSQLREITLSEEIQTLKLYMNLENLRFNNPFSYQINIAPNIDPETTLVPPLIMQPFIENAIKHGFSGLDKPGQISISVLNAEQYMVCMIEDNGKGRLAKQNIKQLSGFKKESFGLKFTEERLNLISEIKKITCYFKIDDLFDQQNNLHGTKVTMYLPLELSV